MHAWLHEHLRQARPKEAAKAGEFNRLAAQLEAYVNETFVKSNQNVLQFTYAEIARDLNLDVNNVHDVLHGVDAGANGLTVFKRPLE
jgi:hypothetical protein